MLLHLDRATALLLFRFDKHPTRNSTTALRAQSIGIEPKHLDPSNKYSTLVETFLCCYKSESEINKHSLFRFTSQNFHRFIQPCPIQMEKHDMLLILGECRDSFAGAEKILATAFS